MGLHTTYNRARTAHPIRLFPDVILDQGVSWENSLIKSEASCLSFLSPSSHLSSGEAEKKKRHGWSIAAVRQWGREGDRRGSKKGELGEADLSGGVVFGTTLADLGQAIDGCRGGSPTDCLTPGLGGRKGWRWGGGRLMALSHVINKATPLWIRNYSKTFATDAISCMK